MNHHEYRELDAVALAGLVRDGEVTAEALLRAAEAAVDEQNGQVNAVVHRFTERATQQIAAGLPAGPLRGVPFLIKDQLELTGTPINYGSKLLDGYTSASTHPIAQRLEAAGLVFIGRTNMSEMGLSPTTEPTRFGPTRNPWNLACSAGGSSGGAAAAVAAGLVPVAHAVDGGGSIRIPAAACGLVGLKPSRGRNPAAADDDPDGFVAHHCVSHTVRDSAAVLDAVHGHGAGRWSLPAPPRPYTEVARQDPRPLRVGFCPVGLFGEPLHPAALEAVTSTAHLLENLGHHVEEVAAPIDTEQLVEAMRVLWSAGAGVFLRLARRGLAATDLPPWVKRLLRRPALFRVAIALPFGGGPPVEPFTRRLSRIDKRSTASDLWLAAVALQEAARALETWFSAHDLLLTTVLTRPPSPLGTLDLTGSNDAITRRLFEYVAFTPVANATGLPAISVPAGHDARTGLPMAAHFMAPLGREDRLLAIAGQLERARPWGRVWRRISARLAA